ncbi:DUF1367 family protein [Pectobacterium sp. CHL-2024]|uniref:DUF1367 family protein n=1 Tax=Pectobacterium sp. CHL-2024 TaxID=3377079 RepID=UPI0038276260
MIWKRNWLRLPSPHAVARTEKKRAGYRLFVRCSMCRQRFEPEAVKTKDAYLNHVMVKAGFYDLTPNPDGGTLKQRWSIAFVNMGQEKFDKVYRGVFGVIWNETLSQYFADQYEMEQAVSQLMNF